MILFLSVGFQIPMSYHDHNYSLHNNINNDTFIYKYFAQEACNVSDGKRMGNFDPNI